MFLEQPWKFLQGPANRKDFFNFFLTFKAEYGNGEPEKRKIFPSHFFSCGILHDGGRRVSMQAILLSIFLLPLAFCIPGPAFSGTRAEQADILVRFKASDSITPQRNLAASLGYREIHHVRRFNVYRWRFHETRGLSFEQTLRILRSDPAVEWAEPNFPRYPQRLPNDPFFSSQWHLLNTGQDGGTPGADIQADSAWDINIGGSQSVVAVLDTGINYNHPDLRPNMWINAGEDWLPGGGAGYNGADDDNNGYIDDYYGISVVPGLPPDPMDTYGHGTHVAGIIGAKGNNGLGVSGVNWNVTLMPLKFIGPQGGDVAGVIECVAYILDQKQKGIPIRIVNASYGGSNYSRFEKEAYEALRDEGILIATSAGNAGSDLDGGAQNYPGSYRLENIINVAATTRYDLLASFSNYGEQSVHLGAPGSDILSTFLDDSYGVFGGTSMAAPQVSGAAALIYSMFDATMLEAKERILRGVDPLASLNGKVSTGGRLNTFGALTVELKGPFIFSLSPITGPPGITVTLTGVRFGAQQNDSRVLFSGVQADIIKWENDKIECRVPEVGSGTDIVVMNSEGVSNSVSFTLIPYRYYLPFAPGQSPWVSYLILTNFSDETVDLKVMASKTEAYVWDTFSERLMPKQSVYRNIGAYGLDDSGNILWVESYKNIQVGLLAAYSDGGLVFVRAQLR
jgi:subtilisin family serine protease